MNILFSLGISEDDIKNMLEQCPEIMDMSDKDVHEKVEILSYIGCNERQIRDIIASNPYYLDRFNSDIVELINYLNSIGITCLNLLFETDPYLLNRDAFEIRDYVNNRKKDGMLLEDIIDEFESNPYIIDEI